MSSQSNLIWFQLVDSNGQPYMGTSADAVNLPNSSIVVQFRDAVKNKYDQPNYLRNIPSSVLQVYKNISSFVNRDVEKPLQSSHHLIDLGKTEEEALIVMVPLSVDNLVHAQQGNFMLAYCL